MTVERRPDASGKNPATYPPEWGDVPADREERRLWILANIEAGRELEKRGRRPSWLAPLEKRG
jgi:hypothetical protein